MCDGKEGHINHSTKRTALVGFEPHFIDVSLLTGNASDPRSGVDQC